MILIAELVEIRYITKVLKIKNAIYIREGAP